MYYSKKCAKCGRYFKVKTGGASRQYCSEKCYSSAYYEKQKNAYTERLEKSPSKNREFTPDTVYLIHKWSTEGWSTKEIAYILARSMQSVQKALDTPITRVQKNTIKEYLYPKNKRRKM